MSSTFKLLVNVSDYSINVLKYLKSNINDINSMPIYINITKLTDSDFDKEMVSTLNASGINKLPALVVSGGKVYEGSKQIKNLFEKNINRLHRKRSVGTARSVGEYGNNPDMENFWRREMKSTEQENEKGLGDNKDLQAAYRAAMEKRRRITQPKGGRRKNMFDSGYDDDDDEYENRPRRPPPAAVDDDDYDDNIAGGDYNIGSIADSIRNTAHSSEDYDPRDDDMEQAMLQNHFGQGTPSLGGYGDY